ncbi:MAG: hypothetical protein IKU52_03220 [Clostridia bacterium]|nr:hypothetical protein [Clostridia bacterium]
MKRINKSSELLWLFGIIFVALGVSLCSKANLGVSMIAAPAFVVQEAAVKLLPNLSVGVTEYIIQGLILIILCTVIRKFNWIYLLAFAVAVIYGYTLDLFMWLLSDINITQTYVRWIMLIIGDLITGFGVACFFNTYMPLQVYELFVAEISSVFRKNISKLKSIFDISLLAISVILAFTLFFDAGSFDWSKIYMCSFHSIGLGTIVTTIINSPIIAISSKLIDRIFNNTALFPKMEKILKR